MLVSPSPPPWRVGAPSYGESWIRACRSSLVSHICSFAKNIHRFLNRFAVFECGGVGNMEQGWGQRKQKGNIGDENCMKMKEFGPRGAHVPSAYLGSTTGKPKVFCVDSEEVRYLSIKLKTRGTLNIKQHLRVNLEINLVKKVWVVSDLNQIIVKSCFFGLVWNYFWIKWSNFLDLFAMFFIDNILLDFW